MSDAPTPPAPPSAPRDFETFRSLIARRRATLPRRLAQVADFAVAAPDEIAFGTAAGIAARAGVQPSTLVRFGQALGFDGFSDLQDVFRDRLRDRVPSYAERLAAAHAPDGEPDQAGHLHQGFTEASLRSIRAASERIPTDRLDAAGRRLAASGTIYLVAQRRSFPATAYMSYLLGKLGIRHALIGSAAGTDPETVAFATPRDAALLISYTPYAPATLALARILRDAAVPSVVVTDSPFSPLVPPDDHWFEIVETDFNGFRPLAATMVLMATLATLIAELRADQARLSPAAPSD